MGEQFAIPVSIYRGGTSKGVFVRSTDLPAAPEERDGVICALMGSPDARQIDGLGGADPLTSKVCILGPPSRPDADIDYTFAQVGIEAAHVSYDINCGNLTSSVAVYAIKQGFVTPTEPETTVRINNTNTRSILIATVPVRDGEPLIAGPFVMDGVRGSGAEIKLDFSATVGGATGHMFPTGGPIDEIMLPGTGDRVQVSVLDLANLSAFVRARDVGMRGDEMPDQLSDATYTKLAAIKSVLVSRFGLLETSFTPMMVAVAPPPRPRSAGESGDAPDLVVRRVRPPHPGFPVGTMHKAYPGTVGACTAVARCIPGTLVWEAAGGQGPLDDQVLLAHPRGLFRANAAVDLSDSGNIAVRYARFSRTARHILDGTAYVMRSRVE